MYSNKLSLEPSLAFDIQLLSEQAKSLEMITDQQEDENSRLKDQLDDADDKMKGMQTTLDSSYQFVIYALLFSGY